MPPADLARFPLFSDLTDECLADLTSNIRSYHVGRGEHVFAEGDIDDMAYLIIDGRVKISRAFADGRENVLMVHGAGDVFGALTMFDRRPRTAAAIALVESEIIGFDYRDFERLLAGISEAGLLLLKIFTRQLRRTGEAMNTLFFTDVSGRLARILLQLASQFGTPYEGPGVRIEHGLTQTELAQFAGASREATNRALSEFVHAGWVKAEKQAVILLDPAGLEERAARGPRLPAHAGACRNLVKTG